MSAVFDRTLDVGRHCDEIVIRNRLLLLLLHQSRQKCRSAGIKQGVVGRTQKPSIFAGGIITDKNIRLGAIWTVI
jgi:hypothetical protein